MCSDSRVLGEPHAHRNLYFSLRQHQEKRQARREGFFHHGLTLHLCQTFHSWLLRASALFYTCCHLLCYCNLEYNYDVFDFFAATDRCPVALLVCAGILPGVLWAVE